jgi:branched-chain amino acid transport system substrate-binding protein
MNMKLTKLAFTLGLSVSMALNATTATAKEEIRVGIVTFLSGPAAGPFGVPGHQGAELLIEAINAGELPPPYDTPGFAGAQLLPIFVDESGGNTKQVAEYRNLVQKQGVDAVIGYISSGSCLSVAPVAEELKMLTIIPVCGSPRLLEERGNDYVFRTTGHAVGDGVAAALYVRDRFGDANAFTGINQNYAWGQDSYKFFDLAMSSINPEIAGSDNPQFPKLFAGQFGTEISTLSLDQAALVHSSFWDGDMETFVLQAGVRGFFQQKTFISTLGASAVDRLGKDFPEGVVMGTRGEYGLLVRELDTPLNRWFVEHYKEQFGDYPLGPSYQYAQSILALKIAMDKAAETAGTFPTQDQTIEALTGLEWDSFGGRISMSLSDGHQAVHPVGYGITGWNDETGEPMATNVVFYPPECIMPPADQTGMEWLAAGMPGSNC